MSAINLNEWELHFEDNDISSNEEWKHLTDKNQECDLDSIDTEFLLSKSDLHHQQKLQTEKSEEKNLQSKTETKNSLKDVQNGAIFSNAEVKSFEIIHFYSLAQKIQQCQFQI
ncbi:hypothetical protein ABPG74_018448 [Tetrahymena malaccensis]